jgi:hypothetical protein
MLARLSTPVTDLLGAVTARLIAEVVTVELVTVGPSPFRASRVNAYAAVMYVPLVQICEKQRM